MHNDTNSIRKSRMFGCSSNLHLLAGIVIASAILVLTGCKVDNPLVRSDAGIRSQGDAIQAARIDPNRYDKADLLDSLRAGKRLHDLGMWVESNAAFENAHRLMPWKEDSVDTPGEVLRLVGTTLTNNTLGSYQGKIFEGGLLSYYKAINTLMTSGEAQVEFNRLEERQANSEAQMKSFIQQAREQARGQLAAQSQLGVERSAQQSLQNFSAGLNEVSPNLRVFEARNPIGDLTSAFFRSTSTRAQLRDQAKIRTALQNSKRSMSSKSGVGLATYIEKKIKGSKGQLQNQVLVLYEDGRGPSLSEFRVDLPLFFVSSKVFYSGMALPKFQKGVEDRPGIVVSNEKVSRMSAPVLDLNRAASLEFRANYDGVVAKEVVSTVLKTAAQYAINKKIDQETSENNNPSFVGTLLKGLTATAQVSLTKADLRYWDNLPNTIHAAIIDRPVSGFITIKDVKGAELARVAVGEPGNYIILARSTSAVGKFSVHTQRIR